MRQSMKMIFRHLAGSRAAFTLMEVNLAILIMAVGVLTMTSLYPLGFRESEAAHEDVRAAVVAEEVLGKLSAALSSRNITWEKWRAAAENAVGKSNNGGIGNAWMSYFTQRGESFTVESVGSVNGHAKAVFDAIAEACSDLTVSTRRGLWCSGESGLSMGRRRMTSPAFRSASGCRVAQVRL